MNGPPSSSAAWRIAAAALFLGSLILRLPGLSEPPLEFQPARQLHSAGIARAYYLDMTAGDDRPREEVRAAEAAKEPEIEPPIMEALAVVGYRLLGAEELWWPRLLSVAWWTAAGVIVLALGRRLFGPAGAVIAAGAHLFLPLGVEASRSFQPDPLMVLLVLVAALYGTDHVRSGTRRSLVAAIAAGSAAVLVKLVAAFFVVPLLVAVALCAPRRRGAVAGDVARMTGLALLPAALYHLYGTFVAGFLRGQEGNRIQPDLLTTRFFWEGWAKRLADLLPGPRPVALVVLLLTGVVAAVAWSSWDRWSRAVVVALGLGYASFGLAFTYHYATHDYYHLPLVPILGLVVGGCWSWVAMRVGGPRLQQSIGVPVALVAALGVATVVAGPALRPTDELVAQHVTRSAAIGATVDHSLNVGYLAEEFGLPLTYYGYLAGELWRPDPDEPAEATFDRLFGDSKADFFVVADTGLLAEEPALRSLLRRRYEAVAQGNGWIVYDLREPAP